MWKKLLMKQYMILILFVLLLICEFSTAQAIGKDSQLRIAKLTVKGVIDNRKTGIKRLLWEVAKRSSVKPIFEPKAITINDKKLFQYPLIYFSGAEAFSRWSDKDIVRMRSYLSAGGTLFIDMTDGSIGGLFDRSVRRLSKRLFPQNPLKKLSHKHTLYQSFYIIRRFGGRVLRQPYLEGVTQDDRTLIIYSLNDLHGAWERDSFGNWTYPVIPGGSIQREHAFRLGVNIIMYALCVNYKADRVHIPLIMQRRK